MLHFDDIVFGPIHSRRLGSSLGINLLPHDGKLCNFDCIYCECGWNRDGVVRHPVMPVAADVGKALESKLLQCREHANQFLGSREVWRCFSQFILKSRIIESEHLAEYRFPVSR